MPGLIGFTRRDGDGDRDTLREMQKLIKHQPFYMEDPLFCDAHIGATRTHKGIVQKDPQPFVNDGLHVWFKGEFYNQKQLALNAGTDVRGYSDPALLALLYRNDGEFDFLRHIDGIYSAVLYDLRKKVLHLITDRYGFGYLYWTVRGGALLWSSEMKAFLAHPHFEPRIDPRTIQDFFGSGFPVENRTWFEDVELVPSGTVLSWDLEEKKLTKKNYWSWNDIRPFTEPIDQNELSEEIARLWVDSVERRSNMGEGRVGISLSGGLDSRAILAAMPDLDYPIHAATVGDPRCDDVRIARKAADLKGAVHHVFDLNEKNWLRLRPSAIWWSDGHIDMKHMHGCVLIDKVRKMYDVNLSGIVGGPVMGGQYINQNGGEREEELGVLSNRGRRFSPCQVQTIDDVFFHSRLPFLDNALVDTVMAIPGKYRYDHRFYKRMLLNHFPLFYKRIPWQKTGLPIGASTIVRKAKEVSDTINVTAFRVARKLGLENSVILHNRRFHNYADWLRREPARTFIDKILANSSSLYPEFIDRNMVSEHWSAHQNGQNRTHHVSQYLTFEIWLQQVFNGAYRNELEEHDEEWIPAFAAH